jgi:hypothetical protein
MLPRRCSPDSRHAQRYSLLFSSSRPFNLHLSFSSFMPSSRIPYFNHTHLPTPLYSHSYPKWRDPLSSSSMEPPLLPTPTSQYTSGRTFRRGRAFLRSSPLRSGVFFGAVVFASLVAYTTFLSPSVWYRPSDWHGFSEHETPLADLEHASLSNPLSEPTTTTTTETSNLLPSPSPSPIPDFLTVEQIRDIVAPTRGFFTRDYSLGLGWNNVSAHGCLI